MEEREREKAREEEGESYREQDRVREIVTEKERDIGVEKKGGR